MEVLQVKRGRENQDGKGRDHHNLCFTWWMAGGGIKGGRIVGATDRLGETPKEKPVLPCDILATVYHVLGIDPTASFANSAGRPIPILDRGSAIQELF